MPAMKRRRGRNASGHVDPFHARRRRYEATLSALGLWDAFAAMPRHSQDGFLRAKGADAIVRLGPSLRGREGREVRGEVEAAVREATLELDGTTIPVQGFWSVVCGCRMLILAGRSLAGEDDPDLPPTMRAFVDQAGPRLEAWWEPGLVRAAQATYHAALGPLVRRGRLDARLLAAEMRLDRTPAGKVVPVVHVNATAPQVRTVRLDGTPRRAFRVGGSSPDKGVDWLTWSGPASVAPAGVPVYVQSHALHQLRERLNLPAAGPYLEVWLDHSLAQPRVTEQAGKDVLVEYRLRGERVGYLAVTPLPDAVVVRTFLFLTMEPSPEARALSRRLRLSRVDTGWLGLNDLAAFAKSDLAGDPVLRRTLEACGCGHLFAFADGADGADGAADPPVAKAAEVRRYLGMAA